jgi:hypothetical protein
VLPVTGARPLERRRRQSTRAARAIVLAVLIGALALATARPSASAATGTVFGVNDDNLRLDWNPARTEVLPASNQIGVWINLNALDRGIWSIPSDRSVFAQVIGARSEWARRPKRYAGAVRELVLAHPNIREVQVWNEPDLCVFPCAQRRDRAHPSSVPFRGPTALVYLSLLSATYQAVHPLGVKVLGFGFSGNIDDRWSPEGVAHQIRRWYRLHHYHRPIMDGFAYHAYCNWQPRYTRRIYRALRRLRLPGGTPRIWWTESGTSQTKSKGVRGCVRGNEAHQARRMKALLAQARTNPQIGGMFNFLLDDAPGDTKFRTGLYRADGTPKPALAVWARGTALPSLLRAARRARSRPAHAAYPASRSARSRSRLRRPYRP